MRLSDQDFLFSSPFTTGMFYIYKSNLHFFETLVSWGVSWGGIDCMVMARVFPKRESLGAVDLLEV